MTEFQGFVFDIDKTAVPNGADSVESDVLREAFAALPEDVVAIAATGRALEFALPITRDLKLKHESVVANGAQIIDSQTGEIRWERLLSYAQVADIINVCADYPYLLYVTGRNDAFKPPAEQKPAQAGAVFVQNVPAEDAHDMREKLSKLFDTHAYLSPAWGGGENEFDINIGHAEARKHNALERLFGKYAIDASKMIGVGDGINDLELFEAVGYRVAVANAHPQLIEQADEVVAAQEDDGLAEVITRFFPPSS